MGIGAYFRTWRNRTTIRRQLSLVVGIVVFILIIALVLYFHAAQSAANLRHEAAAIDRVLELEAGQLEDYLSELEDYSLRLRNDAAFMAVLNQRGDIGYDGQLAVENAFRTLFYSRDDIEWMELYLIKPRLALRIDGARRKVLPGTYQDPSALEDGEGFLSGPKYLSVQPDAAGFVRVTRTIIDSPRTTPLAVVRFLVDGSRPALQARRHGENGERLYLFDARGADLAENGDAAAVYAALQRGATALDGCLLTGRRGVTGLTLAVAKPLDLINAALNRTRNRTILIGLITLVLGLLVVSGAIHMLTRPLSELSRRLQDVGSGNFTRGADLQGSYEMIGLSDEANHMIANISELIDRTYVATLNERTARLAALEAQTNPHFLFNTLQAIATEAILAGDDKVYRMVTSLAALLRYTVRGGNLARLSTELDTVKKYLMLQKSRFDERLMYEIHADERLLDADVPKLGLLALTENAIVHGMAGAAEGIHMAISCLIEGENAVIRVSDDGAGIPPERMAEIRRMIAGDGGVPGRNIGLGNLASRLRLLYGGRAWIEVDSRVAPERETVVRMMIPMEVLEHAQGADCR